MRPRGEGPGESVNIRVVKLPNGTECFQAWHNCGWKSPLALTLYRGIVRALAHSPAQCALAVATAPTGDPRPRKRVATAKQRNAAFAGRKGGF